MRRPGFTLIELLVVIALLGLAAALVIPQMNSVQVLRVQAALRTIVADITFAQADAIAFQQRRALLFDMDTNGYNVLSVPGSEIDTGNTLYLPSGPNGRYSVTLNTPDYAGARIVSTDFEQTDTLIFDDMGAPVAATTGDTPGRGGSIRLTGSGQTYDIVVEPFTGRVVVRKIEAEVVAGAPIGD